MIVPSLTDIIDITDIFSRISIGKHISIRHLIKKIGLEDLNVKDFLSAHNLNYDYEVDVNNIKDDKEVISFLEDIKELMIENARNEKSDMKKYFKEMNFEGKIAIVDIGWHGTMQKAIVRATGNKEIYGYYMGIVPNTNKEDMHMKGFLFDNSYNERLYDKFRYFIGIFEFLFLAQEGSTKKYYNNKNGYLLYDYEYSDTSEKEYAIAIQEGAIEYIKDNKESENEECYKNLLKIMLHPSYKYAVLFGNIKFVDNEERYIAKPRGLSIYFRSPSEIKKDFIQANWRIGFLKRLLKIPLPYYRINELIRRAYFSKKG